MANSEIGAQPFIDETIRLLDALTKRGRGDGCAEIVSWARQEVDEIYAWEKSPAAIEGGLIGFAYGQERRWRSLLNTLNVKVATANCEYAEAEG